MKKLLILLIVLLICGCTSENKSYEYVGTFISMTVTDGHLGSQSQAVIKTDLGIAKVRADCIPHFISLGDLVYLGKEDGFYTVRTKKHLQ